jgi:RNA polymerase sigma-70 factor (ECF subfamily)
LAHLEDSEILERLRQGENMTYAFNLLVRKYQQKIYWTIRRMILDHDDTNDVMQNVWIKVWKGLDNFKEESQLYTWIYRIATNETLTFIDKKKRKATLKMEDYENLLNEKVDDNTLPGGEELELKLQKAMLQLPEKQRIVFQMRYYDETSYEDLSKILNTSVGALKASYHHAAKKIENYFMKGD